MSIEIRILNELFASVQKIYSVTDIYDIRNVIFPASDKCTTTTKSLEIMTYKHLERRIYFVTVCKKEK